MKLKAYDKNGNEVKSGEVIVDFRGDKWTFVMASRASLPSRSGKIIVTSGNNQREFYDRVFGLTVKNTE